MSGYLNKQYVIMTTEFVQMFYCGGNHWSSRDTSAKKFSTYKGAKNELSKLSVKGVPKIARQYEIDNKVIWKETTK